MSKVQLYLKKNNIKANIVKVTTPDESNLLDPENLKEWEDLVRKFSTMLDVVLREMSPQRIHIFLSAPLALTFGIGCTIGNIVSPFIYHLDNVSKEYKLVITADNRLRKFQNL